jgi:cytochrome d ubiquinol oxidase subunit II
MAEAWFAILAGTFIAFAVLEGWDIGAGMLHFVVARSQAERRQLVSALGPLWTWHEVWLIAAGGTLFLAFPSVLGSALAGFYLAVFVVIWCFLLRGLALEFGGHLDDPMWRTFWDTVLSASSVLLALLLGAAMGNILRGVPLDERGSFSLPFFTHFGVHGRVGIVDWYTASVALFTAACLAMHGASYLVLKTAGRVHDRSLALAQRLWPVVVTLLLAVTVATRAVRPDLFTAMAHRPLAWVLAAAGLGGAVAVLAGQRTDRELLAFAGSSLLIAGILGAGAASVFPVMLHSTLDPQRTLTAYATVASGGRGLSAALFWWPLALVLSVGYALVVLRGFRGRVTLAEPAPSEARPAVTAAIRR